MREKKTLKTNSVISVVGTVLLIIANGAHAAGWTGPAKIKSIAEQPSTSTAGYNVNIETATDPSPASTCTSKRGFYFSVSTEREKRMFSMLLSAQMAGKDVRFYFTDAPCHAWGMAQLDGVVVQD